MNTQGRPEPAEDVGRFRFGRTEIQYRIVRSNRRRRTAITVDAENGVTVRLPADEARSRAQMAVARKAEWIVQRQALLRGQQARPPREFVEGETFLYLGRQYRLKLSAAAHGQEMQVRLLGRHLTVTGLGSRPNAPDAQGALGQWYRRHADARLRERVALYTKRLGIELPRLLVRDQRKRWGSCSRAGVLRFNWRIIMAPLPLVDYVVVHELCHLVIPDHSPRFWRLLRRCLPDADARRERLLARGADCNYP